MRRTALALVMLVICAAACGGEAADVNTNPNPNTNPDPNAAVLEVGKGATTFEALADAEELTLVMAPQTGGFGFGQHVDVALRAQHLEPANVTVHVVLRDASQTYSDVTQKVSLVQDGDWWFAAGIRAVIDNCGDVSDKPLELVVEVEDENAKKGTATKSVRGPMLCPRLPG